MQDRLGMICVDLDRHAGGSDGVQVWDENPVVRHFGWTTREAPDRTFCERTPSGGWHLWFVAPPGLSVPTSHGAIGAGIDLLSDNAIAVTSPTAGYAAVSGPPTVSDIPAVIIGLDLDADWQARLARSSGSSTPARTRERAYLRRVLDDECQIIRRAVKTCRHETIRDATIRVIAVALGCHEDPTHVEHSLLEAARHVLPEDTRDAERTVRDALSWGVENCTPRGPSYQTTLADFCLQRRLEDWRVLLSTFDWRGHGGPTRRAVAEAIVQIAEINGRGTISPTTSDLSILANVCDSTFRRHRGVCQELCVNGVI
jgi:hypothetical protein